MEVEVERPIDVNKGFLCLLCSLLIGVIFDRMFFDKQFGISFFIFIALCIALFLWFLKDRLSTKSKAGWFMLVPIGLLSFSYTVYTNAVFMALNVLVVTILMVASSILINNPDTKWDEASFIFKMVRKALVSVLGNLPQPFKIIHGMIRFKEKSEINQSRRQIILGLIISLPILVVVLMLLSSADMVFNYYISNITHIFQDLNPGIFVSHFILIAVISFYIFGYVWGFREGVKEEDVSLGLDVNWAPITVITVLIVLNLLYLMFTVIQFSYLYGGGNMTLPAGFTYAEYARKGFFELATVTFINFVIVLSCMKFIRRENKRLLVLGNVLFSILIVFTLNMLYSASLKLSLYESTYGYTYLRVFVHIFMLLLFMLCLVVLTGIWYRRINIVKSIIVFSITAYTIVNYINIDGFIAKKNLELYRTNGKVDIYYLTSLSYEALPYILELQTSKDFNVKEAVNYNIKYRKDTLTRQNSWTEFNFSRNKAKELLGVK